MTNNIRPEITARHIATCAQRLGEALHYHRFFGHPIAAFSLEHNASRAEINDRTVKALATIAGEFCAYAGYAPDDVGLFGDVAARAVAVDMIRDALVAGFYHTLETLRVVGNDPTPLDGPAKYR